MTAATGSGWVVNDPRLQYDDASHIYTLGERRLISVTQVLGLVGLADFTGPWFTDAIKARGSRLHQAIALDVEEALDEASVADDIRGGLDGWRRFLLETGAAIEWWETPLCDPALGVAGRMDGIVQLALAPGGRRERWLIDVKRGLYPCAAIQLAAYVDMAAALYDGPVYLKRAALVVPGDGSYRFEPFVNPLDRTTWQAAVRIVNWRREHGLIAA